MPHVPLHPSYGYDLETIMDLSQCTYTRPEKSDKALQQVGLIAKQ